VGSVLAVAGIVAGFLLWIVPGFFALRSYRRWKQGLAPRPTFAWVALAVFVLLAVGAWGVFYLVYGRPLLEEDFSDRENSWHTAGPPNTAAFVDGAFELGVGSGRTDDFTVSGLRWAEGSFPNVAVEGDVSLLEGDAFAGVGCFDVDGGAGYLFLLSSGGRWEIRSVLETFPGSTVAAGAVSVDPSRVARIRGECRGGAGEHELRILIDDRLLHVVEVPPVVFEYSGVALAIVANDDEDARATFDDVLAIAIQPSAD
jgi:hypothetical protein